MAMAAIETRTAAAHDARGGIAGLLAGWPLAVVLIAAGFLQQAMGELNCDVSWFITFAARVHDGATAYVDISDPNPPAAFLLYMPAVIAARALGWRIEAMTVIQLALVLALSLWLVWRVLRAAGLLKPQETGLLRNAALFVLFVAPGYVFAEREHFAMLFALPIVAVYVARGEGRPVAAPLAVAAGLCAGVTLCFKPHFGLVLALPGLAMLARRRSIAPLFAIENFLALGVFGAYFAAIHSLYPAYFSITLPEIFDVYLLARHSILETLLSPLTWLTVVVFGGAIFAARRVGPDVRAGALLLAATGFALAYLVQGKLWSNHAAPAIELGMLACCVLWVGHAKAAPEFMAKFAVRFLVPVLIVLPFFATAQHNLLREESYPGLTDAVRRIGPAHPRIASLSEMMDVGHPLVRRVDGVWIGRQNAAWRVNMTNQILQTSRPDAATRARLLAISAHDRAELAEDVARGQPDLVLVETAALRVWALGTPELAHLLDGYERRAQAGDIEIWARAARP